MLTSALGQFCWAVLNHWNVFFQFNTYLDAQLIRVKFQNFSISKKKTLGVSVITIIFWHLWSCLGLNISTKSQLKFELTNWPNWQPEQDRINSTIFKTYKNYCYRFRKRWTDNEDLFELALFTQKLLVL